MSVYKHTCVIAIVHGTPLLIYLAVDQCILHVSIIHTCIIILSALETVWLCNMTDLGLVKQTLIK